MMTHVIASPRSQSMRRSRVPSPEYCQPRSIRLIEQRVYLVDLDAPSELLILVTDELDQLGIGHDLLINPDRKRFRVRLRVIHGHVDCQASEARACKPLSKFCLAAVRTTTHVEPA